MLLAASRVAASHRRSVACSQKPLHGGRVWLAGEATHARYSGYLQGAYLSGKEAVARMIRVDEEAAKYPCLLNDPADVL